MDCVGCGAPIPTIGRVRRARKFCSKNCRWRFKASSFYYAHLTERRAYLRERAARLRKPRPPAPCSECQTHERVPGRKRCAVCLACATCGQIRKGGGRFCSASCYDEWRRAHRADPRIGLNCKVWIRTCAECGRLFTARYSHVVRCSKRCNRDHLNNQQRDKNREHQRRTRYTAIRYWAVDSSPEALALAATYFELRQQLRSVHRGATHGR